MEKYSNEERLTNIDIDYYLEKITKDNKNCVVFGSDKVTIFIGGEEARRKKCMEIEDKTIFCTEMVFVIYNDLSQHWSVAIYFKDPTPRLYHYDSYRVLKRTTQNTTIDESENNEKFLELCIDLIKHKIIPKETKIFDPKTWVQENDWECGFFVLYFVYMVFREQKLNYGPLSINEIVNHDPKICIPLMIRTICD